MKKPNTVSNETEALSDNVHRNSQWLVSANKRAKKQLSPKMYQLYCDYSDELLLNAHSTGGRKKILVQFVAIVTRYKIEDLKTITPERIKEIVLEIMKRHSNNGQETWYSADMKKQVRMMIRFAKTGSHLQAVTGDLPELLFIKCRKIKDKLSREDLPTDDDCQQILRACSDSLMDRAMLSVHMEAGTRIKELLSMQIKHVVIDEYGAMIAVDGKTGARKIRIVSSVPYLVKWINAHPYKDDRNHALFISTHANKYFGCGLTYVGFKSKLNTIVARTGIKKRVSSHLFRHKEITDLAGKLTEAESRIRHGWDSSSNMPSRYTHLNNTDVDNKMLELMGVKKKDVEDTPTYLECHFCHVKHPIDTKYCEACAKPLDVVEAERMQKESEDKTQAMVYELLRKEKSDKVKRNHQGEKDKEVKEQLKQQAEEIQMLKDMVNKMSKAE